MTPTSFTPTAAGRTASFGYGTLAGRPKGRGGIGAPGAPGATPHLVPSEGIGISPVRPENVNSRPADAPGRKSMFIRGLGEALPGAGGILGGLGGGAAAGGEGAAAGIAGAVEELAPLALAAL